MAGSTAVTAAIWLVLLPHAIPAMTFASTSTDKWALHPLKLRIRKPCLREVRSRGHRLTMASIVGSVC